MLKVRGDNSVSSNRKVAFELSIRPSVGMISCRDGTSEISRDPRTKRLKTQPKRLGWP